MKKYENRMEVPDKYKWDLTPFFKDEEEFNNSFKKCSDLVKKIKSYIGCTKNSNKLYEFLKLDIEVSSLYEDLYVYSYLINDQELGVASSIARKAKVENLGTKLEEVSSFFAPELLKLDKEEYNKLFENKDLLEFKETLDSIYRSKEHILSEEEEKIISILTDTNYDDMSSNLLNVEHNYGKVKIDNDKVTIATNNYGHLLRNKDAKIRKEVYTKLNKVLSQYSESNASFLNAYVKTNDNIARIRKYKDSWDAKLFDLNISNNVFEALKETTENNVDVLQKYFTLKKKCLNLDVLHPYDLNVEMSSFDKEYSIEDAQDLCLKSIKPLGDNYISKFRKVFDNHYIDYCQYKGKCSGGYSFSTINQDSRILLSYNGNLDSVSTIIHEGGHNVHHQYVKENNLKQYRNPSSLVCEVASLTNECLLSNYLMNNGSTKNEKLSGIENILDVIVSNLYGAVREGKMEQDMYNYVHKGNALTKEYLDKLAYKSLKKYYSDTVKLDKYSKNNWVRRSHYYMHFYLYSYAICISVATYVASKIIDGNKEVLDKYIKFLSTGSDKYPMDVFKVLGINLEEKEVYEEAIKYFDTLIDKYNEIYNS